MAINLIESMLPGIVYLSAKPGAPPFKQPGDQVLMGETVALVEVMKSFMPLEADRDGTFVRYVVAADAMIEAGDAICEIDA